MRNRARQMILVSWSLVGLSALTGRSLLPRAVQASGTASRHRTGTCPPPLGRSRGRVSTQSLPEVESTRQLGQHAGSGSSVTSCTIRTPPPVGTTHPTANPHEQVALSLLSTTVGGSPSAVPKHSEDHRVTGRLRSGAPNRLTAGCRSRLKSSLIILITRRPRPEIDNLVSYSQVIGKHPDRRTAAMF